ncbi:hypothetical protein QCA50_014121 [Cerrena zonata]|uniref:Uncharacterized protein n=1 Tax=Cerrena zonata TaxID=2478898 RepID=A0AAW0FP04_9APHY
MPTDESPITHVFTGKGHEFRVEQKESPPFQLLSLTPSPQPQSTIAMPQPFTTPPDDYPQPPQYPSFFEQPYFDPHETLYKAHNIVQSSIATSLSALPKYLDMILLQDATFLPTHILAVIDTPKAPIPADSKHYTDTIPILVPINYTLFASKIRTDFSSLFPDVSSTTARYRPPQPREDRRTRTLVITLPVIPFQVPHPPSFSLLLLFSLGLHATCIPDKLVGVALGQSGATSTPEPSGSSSRGRTHMLSPHSHHETSSPNLTLPQDDPPFVDDAIPHAIDLHTTTGLLATYLLPIPVIEEFPAFGPMVQLLQQIRELEDLKIFRDFNTGLWRNLLSIAPKDQQVHDIARVAFKVTIEAVRLRELYIELERLEKEKKKAKEAQERVRREQAS